MPVKLTGTKLTGTSINMMPGADLTYNSVTLLTHMNGTPGFTPSDNNSVYFSSGSNLSSYSSSISDIDMSGAFTIECWLNPDNINFGQIIGTADYNGAIDGWAVSISPTYGLSFYYGRYGHYQTIWYTGAGTISAGAWVHIAICRDTSSNWYFFINGIKYTRYTFNQNHVGSDSVSLPNMPFIVGSGQSGAYTGYISNLKVSSGVARYTNNFSVPTTTYTFTPGDGTVLLICQKLSFIDVVSNHLMTPSSPPPLISTNGLTSPPSTYIDSSRYNRSIVNYNSYYVSSPTNYLPTSGEFSGAAYLRIPYASELTMSADFTLEFWVNMTSANDTNKPSIYCSPPNGSTTQGSYNIYCNGNTSIVFGIYLNAIYTISATGLTSGQWNHIAIVRESSIISIYANGIKTGFITASVPLGVAGSDHYVGYNPVDGGYFVGNLSDLRITNGTSRYTGNSFVVPTLPFPDM
jgi:hypothetical protein